jgi:hypothetical protein
VQPFRYATKDPYMGPDYLETTFLCQQQGISTIFWSLPSLMTSHSPPESPMASPLGQMITALSAQAVSKMKSFRPIHLAQCLHGVARLPQGNHKYMHSSMNGRALQRRFWSRARSVIQQWMHGSIIDILAKRFMVHVSTFPSHIPRLHPKDYVGAYSPADQRLGRF